MLQDVYPFYLANQPVQANCDLVVHDKFSGKEVTRVALANANTIDEAIAWTVRAKEPLRAMPAFKRQEILMHCVEQFRQRYEELATILCIEAGKPIKDSRGEVTRLIDTFRVAAEEAVRIHGEVLPMDITARAAGYRGMWKPVPIGPCSFISPFNFPLNLVAHKIAPALAAGCPFVLKPASKTPVGALIIGEILAETDLPQGAFSILPAPREDAETLILDERLKLLSFTGSPTVGWALKDKAGKKKVMLELGGNAACLVDHDTDLDYAVERITFGAFYTSGQSCVSVQRIIVHEDIYEDFKQRLVAKAKTLRMGNPMDEDNFIGPMISETEATRLHEWIGQALTAGGKLLCGNKRKGAMLSATLLEDVPRNQKVVCQEAFGPVAVLSKFNDFTTALAEINDTRYGLQAGLFTRDIHKANQAWDQLEVGAVIIGDVPSFRVDHMPYGGIRHSGLGREGIKYAIHDMTEMRLLVTNDNAAT